MLGEIGNAMQEENLVVVFQLDHPSGARACLITPLAWGFMFKTFSYS